MSDATPTPPVDPSAYEQERRAKRDKLIELGVDPFGGRVEGVEPLAVVRAKFDPSQTADNGPDVIASGRVMLARRFGKLTFLTLRDDTGDLQVALDKKRLPDRDWQAGELIDLGDQIVAFGKLAPTKKGEPTIWADKLQFAAKALLPPPEKWSGLSDVELRYRQRYVDLWANPEVLRLAKLRIRIVDEIRAYLRGRGFLEVETPMLQPIHGGAAARPFVTRHNALDMQLYMRIAPELYLKRLLVGGFSKVFEINRNFRNEGISPRHNPEFTMLEAYEAFGSFETMAELVEGMICHVAETVFGTLKIEHKNANGEVTKTINLQRPWRRVRMADLVEERTGWRFDKRSLLETQSGRQAAKMLAEQFAERLHDEWTQATDALDYLFEERRKGRLPDQDWQVVQDYLSTIGEPKGVDKPDLERVPLAHFLELFLKNLRSMQPAEQLQHVYEKLVEPTLIDPTFVTHVPSVIIPLARENRDDPFFADVYELAINGQEISPGYSELNDPDKQRQHFSHQVGDREEQQQIDEDFLTALKYGMPPAGGLGLGIDRLVMMLTGAESIRDVVLFPLMKPQG